jgi:hypothetical protein
VPHEDTDQFHHLRAVAPSRFRPGSFRTIRVGTHRVILGVLKEEKRHTRSGRLRQTVQAVLHPKHEMLPLCRGCFVIGHARRFNV